MEKDRETWKHETWTWRHRDMEHGNMETYRNGNMDMQKWTHGDMDMKTRD